jgi:hypothetical protein
MLKPPELLTASGGAPLAFGGSDRARTQLHFLIPGLPA